MFAKIKSAAAESCGSPPCSLPKPPDLVGAYGAGEKMPGLTPFGIYLKSLPKGAYFFYSQIEKGVMNHNRHIGNGAGNRKRDRGGQIPALAVYNPVVFVRHILLHAYIPDINRKIQA
jgi:hypothetical protein